MRGRERPPVVERNPGEFALSHVKSDADAFRKRAKDCRDVANGTKDLEAQRELRDLATELGCEAERIDAEQGGEA